MSRLHVEPNMMVRVRIPKGWSPISRALQGRYFRITRVYPEVANGQAWGQDSGSVIFYGWDLATGVFTEDMEAVPAEECRRVEHTLSHPDQYPELYAIGSRIKAVFEQLGHIIPISVASLFAYQTLDDLLDDYRRYFAKSTDVSQEVEAITTLWNQLIFLLDSLGALEGRFIRSQNN